MSGINITDAIFAVADRHPHAVAVIDGETVISYRSLCNAIIAVAQRFHRAGWRAGDIAGIAIQGRQSLHLLVALALARMGITQVVLPVPDSAASLTARIRRLGISGIVSDLPLSATMNIRSVVAQPEWWAAAAPAEDLRDAGGDRLWTIAETSGTTGEPKTIGISHVVEVAHGTSLAPVFAHLPGERFLNLTRLHFLTAMKRAICCLADGGALSLPPAGLTAAQMLQWIDRHDIAYLSCVPVHLHQMLGDIPVDHAPRLPSLRVLRTSSAALPPVVLKAVRERISPNLYVNYGATETGPMVAATPALLEKFPEAVGLPLRGIKLEIVDDEDQPLPAETSGHVRVRGTGIVSAYLHADAQDAARVFRDGWCYPGDVGRINAEGVVFLEGRADEVMNFNGIMICPGEIESVLRQHRVVLDVAAFPLPSLMNHEVPAVAIVSSRELPLDELKSFCAGHLGVRAPQAFFRVDEIPKNATGKVLRRKLTALAVAERRNKSQLQNGVDAIVIGPPGVL